MNVEERMNEIRGEKLNSGSSYEECTRRCIERSVARVMEFSSGGIDEAAVRVGITAQFEEALNTLLTQIGETVIIGPPPPKTIPASLGMLWKRYQKYLIDVKRWKANREVKAIDDSTKTILPRLGISVDGKFDIRGLVVGYVQSGKTANMMGLAAKAVDQGFNFIIILAGLTDALRQQTQDRVISDLVEREERHWNVLTTLDRDYVSQNNGFQQLALNHRFLAVIKKNRYVLDRIITDIEQTAFARKKNWKVLILDDECDQASVNASNKPEVVTAINQRIRDLLGKFDKSAYVGYTATPFANVLIDPDLKDLYPRDFIAALPEPASYWGARKLFGGGLLDVDEEDSSPTHSMLRSIPVEEREQLCPPRKVRGVAPPFNPSMTDTLEDALCWFLISCAIRNLRGHHGEHFTMLVHTSVLCDAHEKVAGLLKDWVKKKGPGKRRFKKVFDQETKQVKAETFDNKLPSFNDVWKEIQRCFKLSKGKGGAIEVVVENSRSDKRLDYKVESGDDGTEYGRRYIVVGGNVLARGLTLEGLVVSFFLRRSQQYDTLMQMGRWFGYRQGYEDLPRMWMTKRMQASFRQLATVEAELREEIRQYAGFVTPLNYAVRIRQFPGMMITSKAKMRAAKMLQVSWAGRHIQTRRFRHQDIDWLNGNLMAAKDLLSGRTPENLEGRGRVWRGLPSSDVVGFLRGYSVHPDHGEFDTEPLVGFIEKMKDAGKMSNWNVALIEPSSATQFPGEKYATVVEADVLKDFQGWKMVGRAKLKDDLEDGGADIKALMSRRDIVIDIPGASTPASWKDAKRMRNEQANSTPLLVMYLINPDSSPKNSTQESSYSDLNAVAPVLGIGLVFPDLKDNRGEIYYSVELPEQDEPDEETEVPKKLLEGGD